MFTLSGLMFCYLQAAEVSSPKQTDAEMAKRIIGTWVVDYASKSYSCKGTISFATNSTYVAEATIGDADPISQKLTTHVERFEGSWQITNAWLTQSVTNCIGLNGSPPKQFAHDKIIRVDENEFSFYNCGKEQSAFIVKYKRLSP
jgi:hypothetical protein